MTIERRLSALERRQDTPRQTAAEIIRKLQAPRNADEFHAWARSLSPTERAAYEGATLAEVEAWEKELMLDEQTAP